MFTYWDLPSPWLHPFIFPLFYFHFLVLNSLLHNICFLSWITFHSFRNLLISSQFSFVSFSISFETFFHFLFKNLYHFHKVILKIVFLWFISVELFWYCYHRIAGLVASYCPSLYCDLMVYLDICLSNMYMCWLLCLFLLDGCFVSWFLFPF